MLAFYYVDNTKIVTSKDVQVTDLDDIVHKSIALSLKATIITNENKN